MPEPPDPSVLFKTDELRQRLEDPRPALSAIGALLVATSEAAFEKQRMGDVLWPPRYPGMEDPFINVAGALGDLNRGTFVKDRRLEKRPALVDKGLLRKSFTFNVLGLDSVRAGPSGPPASYAPQHHFGLDTVQPILPVARETLTKQRRKATGQMKEALGALGFIYSLDEMETSVAPRPLVGIPDETAGEIGDLVKEFMEDV